MELKGDENDYYNLSLGQILFLSMKRHKLKTAQIVIDTNERYSYENLLSRCIRVALKLKQQGYGDGDIISSCTRDHENHCVPFISSLFIGAIPATFDPDLPTIDTVHLLKLVEPKVMFVSLESLEWMERCIQDANVHTEVVVFENNSKYSKFSEYLQPTSNEAQFTPSPIESSKITAAILFSSGTTGLPKGICLSHISFIKNLDLKICFDKDPVESEASNEYYLTLSYTSLYWISGVGRILRNITEGIPTLICSTYDPSRFWEIVEKYKVNCFFAKPHNIPEILKYFKSTESATSLKMITTGGYSIREEIVRDLQRVLQDKVILQYYAQTEVCGLITMFDPSDPVDLAMLSQKPTSCGRILDRWKWKVIDPDTGLESRKGELWIKSDYMMNGYYKMDCSSRYDADGYMTTGDIVYYDDEGCFYIVDRVRDTLKYKGIHVSPSILEEILCSHPAIKEAVVTGIPDSYGDNPVAIVVLNEDLRATPEEIRQYVDEKVSEPQKLRGGVRIVEKLPRTLTGKVSKRMIRDLIISDNI